VCADAEALARYTAREVPHFEVLRESDLLMTPINRQVREVNKVPSRL